MNKPEAPPTFIVEAEAFASAHRDRLAFRLLKRYMGCDEREYGFLLKALYCLSCPQNTYDTPEGAIKTYAGLLLLPWHFLLTKKLRWTPGPRVDYAFESGEPDYFLTKYVEAYRGLEGRKRLTTRSAFSFENETTDPVGATARWRDLPGLFVVGLVASPLLFLLERGTPLKLLKGYRQALSLYTTFRGYFARYPCRDFVTTQDEINHPARYIAFRRECPGELIAIQNGERNVHPLSGFGLVDRYLVFGEAYARILRRVGVEARGWTPVGSPGLDETYARLKPVLEGAGAPEWDVILLDQGVRPFNGLGPRTGAGLETLIARFGELKRRRPGLRLAYQLRWYDPAGPVREPTLDAVRRLLGDADIAFLPNDGKGESYLNCLRARLVLTFQSTLGFESMLLGRKVLFVNYTGDPAETVCPDDLFQLEDEDADYARLEAKVEGLLALTLAEVPLVARERNFADGRMCERIAAAVNSRASRASPAGA